MATAKNRRSAAASSDGTLAQFDLGLFTLAERKYKSVGIETLDDVGAETATGQKLAAQSKQSLSDRGNTVSWRSVQLWKTLSIWIEAISNGVCNVNDTAFVLVARSVAPGLRVQLIGAEPQTIADFADRLLKEASRPVATLVEYFDVVNNHGRKGLIDLLSRCRVSVMTFGSDATLLKDQLGLSEDVDADELVTHLRGWIVGESRKAWSTGKPAWISQAAFNKQLHRAMFLFDRKKRAVRQWRDLRRGLDPKTADRSILFVRQLLEVNASEDEVIESIVDHFGHGEERDRLTREGAVFADQWADYDEALIRQWRPRHRSCCTQSANQKSLAGLCLYREICGLPPLNVADVLAHAGFCIGAYHRLAGSLKIGWHPDFSALFKANA